MERPEEPPGLTEDLMQLNHGGSVILIVETSGEAERQVKTLSERGVNAAMRRNEPHERNGRNNILVQTTREVADAAEPEFLDTAVAYTYLAFSQSVDGSRVKVPECFNGALTAMFGRVGAQMVKSRLTLSQNSGAITLVNTRSLEKLLGSGAEQVKITYLRNIHTWLHARRRDP